MTTNTGEGERNTLWEDYVWQVSAGYKAYSPFNGADGKFDPELFVKLMGPPTNYTFKNWQMEAKPVKRTPILFKMLAAGFRAMRMTWKYHRLMKGK